MDSEALDEEFTEFIEEDFSELDDLKFTTDSICENEEHTEFICFYCFNKFESHIDLLGHIETEHFTFTCEKCNKQFPTDKRLKKHLRDAHLSGKFPCPLCDKVFTRKDHCKDHVYTHSDKPLFRCKYDKCEKVFRQPTNLKQHERIHTGDNRRTCPICNESVVHLSAHLNSHLETKRHPCNTCNKSFSRRIYLREHEKLHLGEIGFICDQCHVEFKSSIALYKHKRSKHSAERYICEITGCRQEFNRKDNMMSHMKRRHKLVVETVNTEDIEVN